MKAALAYTVLAGQTCSVFCRGSADLKKILILALAAAFALSLFILAGCEQDKSQIKEGDSMGGTRISFIDVGKGDCILLQTGGSAALIDTGYKDTSDEVLSYLQAQGVSHLDCLIITHHDRDHVGGLRAIGKALGIGTVYLPGYEGSDKNYQTVTSAVDDLGLNAQSVAEPLHLKLGDSDLDIFPSGVEYIPGSMGEEGNDNDLSLVTTLTGDGGSYLFAGDLEEDGIAAFLEAGHGRFDVLKVPHHGEKSSNTDELLEAVRPQIAVITDSVDDPAAKKTLKLLDEIGADTFRTSTSGPIVVQNDAAGRYSVSG